MVLTGETDLWTNEQLREWCGVEAVVLGSRDGLTIIMEPMKSERLKKRMCGSEVEGKTRGKPRMR